MVEGDPVLALAGIDLNVAEGEFFALMGPVGAGKSTLCYALNGAIPHIVDGTLQGEVVVLGQATDRTSMGQLAMQVGLVFEDVQAQLFNATVADEVAFGLEGMGLPVAEINERIHHALDLVGLNGLCSRAPRTLSGGEQKRLALACVLAMRPRVLILDEPTQGLDPLARKSVIQAIDRLRQSKEGGMTVVLSTLDAETVAQFADRVAVLNEGQIVLCGSPSHVFGRSDCLDSWGIPIPQLARLADRLSTKLGLSLDPAKLDQAGSLLRDRGTGQSEAARSLPPAAVPTESTHVVQVRDLGHRYSASDRWALAECSLEVAAGEWLAIIGVNGSGKSTLLKHLNGLLKPACGAVCVDGLDTRTAQVGELARKVGYLPQNPDHLIFSPTVRQEVAFGPRQLGLRGKELDKRISEALRLLDIEPFSEHPPAILGYGLRRKVALASVLSMRTPILALDEPTVGLDQRAVERLLAAVQERHCQGTTVIMVTHDLRWVARYAQRVVVLYGGRIAAQGRSVEVLADLTLLENVQLGPLPVTALAALLGWARPLPISVPEFVARVCCG